MWCFRVLRRMEPLAKKVSGYAMESTQQVNYAQNSQRKKFLLHVKQEMANRLQTKKAWQQLIQQLTHERYDDLSRFIQILYGPVIISVGH